MVAFAFNNVSIKGISTVVPEKELILTDDKSIYDGNEKKINRVVESSGFLKRRVTDEKVMTSDLCFFAAEDLIKNLNVKKEEIDALLFISYTPDFLMPATSYVLHKRLGLSQNCVVMDIPQACSGYVIGLYQASMLINAGCKKVLLLVGDSFSKFTDMFINHTAPVFGDAGSATLIEYDKSATKSYYMINSDGENYDALICENGAFRNPAKQNNFYKDGNYKYGSKMDGGRIFDFTMQNIAPSIEELFRFSGKSVDNIDHVVFHQANKFILQNIAEKLNIPEYKYTTETLTNYGNQCGASIPCTISNTLQKIVSAEEKLYLFSGFGVGLSWASTILTIGNIYCSTLNTYR